MENLDLDLMKELIENGGVVAPPSYFTQVPDMFSRRTDLTISEKMLFIYLWGYAANKGHAFPGQARMMEELGITKPTLRKLLAGLEEKNGIFAVTQIKENGSKTSNLYFLAEVDMKTGLFNDEFLNIRKKMYPDKVRYIDAK